MPLFLWNTNVAATANPVAETGETMNHSTLGRSCRKALAGFKRPMSGAVMIAVTVSVSHAADDAYLEQLDEEVTKVEAVPTDTGRDGAARPAKTAGGAGTREVASREQFEASLRDQHVGTYSFYRRLPERSREEVFLDYSRGASMESLREKVIERFLHP